MKKIEINKKKLNIILTVLGIIIIVLLCAYGYNKNSDKTSSLISSLFPIDDEIVIGNSITLEQELKSIPDKNKFYPQTVISLDYDKIFVVISDLTRDQICEDLNCYDKHITNKGADDFELIALKDNKVVAIITGRKDEIKMNFRKTEGVDYDIYVIEPNMYDIWNIEIDENEIYNYYY